MLASTWSSVVNFLRFHGNGMYGMRYESSNGRSNPGGLAQVYMLTTFSSSPQRSVIRHLLQFSNLSSCTWEPPVKHKASRPQSVQSYIY